MTAEVVVLNRHAVALAADSAITIQGKKVINSANKLFMLAPGHSVGILIFNNASLMGVSWELLITLYRNHLLETNQRFQRLEQYGKDFFGFVEKQSKGLFSPVHQRDFFTALAHDLLGNKIYNTVDHEFKRLVSQTAAPVAGQIGVDIARAVIDQQCIDWEAAPPLYTPSKSVKITRELKREYYSIFDQIYAQFLGSLGLDNNDKKRLWETCVNWFTRKLWFNAHYTGIGIAGYGDDDLFPGFMHYNVESYMCRTLKHVREKVVSAYETLGIFPLAQDEVIQTIIAGVHPQGFRSLQEKFLVQIGSSYEKILAANNPNANATDIKRQAATMAETDFLTLDQSLHNDMFDKYTRRIIEIVGSLPKDELALMAETLVSITSFMKRVSADLETVGGPTDVAVISKKDGFIWIKRKHYFEPDRNYHFFTDRQLSSISVMWGKEFASMIAELKSAIESLKD